jgi:hypothetical protein
MDATVQTTETQLKGKVVYIPEVDKTLTKDGYSADAKVTGDRLNAFSEVLDELKIQSGSIASGVYYNNETSELSSNDVQGAIDELVFSLRNMSSGVTDLLVDALRKSEGGMIEGTLMVRNADNGYGSLMKNNSATADYGTQFSDVTKDGKVAKATVNASANLFTFVDTEGNIRDIHHEGNKQFGNYSGNGSATERVINTQSIGRLIIVYNAEYFSFVTPQGAWCRNLVEGTDRWIESTKAMYLNGKLTLALTNDALNKNGTTYHYQAI